MLDTETVPETHVDEATQTERKKTDRVYHGSEGYRDPIYDWTTYENDNQRVQYYTGLTNFAVMCLVMKMLFGHINPFRLAVDVRTQVLIVLVKLRMNYDFRDMANHLHVHFSTVNRIFHETLHVMYYRLSFLVRWPEREILRKTMPLCFRDSFGDKITVIVDCFEQFTEKPFGAKNQIFTFSFYKHHHTIKYLIGISPQGVITFISPGWGGRTSDNHVTENSNFFKNLLPDDVMMADRGFTCQDEVSFFQAKLMTPSFTKGKLQMHPMDVETTRLLAHVRIHVERVIGLLLRKFKIFEGNFTLEFLHSRYNDNKPTCDKIVHVCCALTNLCSSVIPFQ